MNGKGAKMDSVGWVPSQRVPVKGLSELCESGLIGVGWVHCQLVGGVPLGEGSQVEVDFEDGILELIWTFREEIACTCQPDILLPHPLSFSGSSSSSSATWCDPPRHTHPLSAQYYLDLCLSFSRYWAKIFHFRFRSWTHWTVNWILSCLHFFRIFL